MSRDPWMRDLAALEKAGRELLRQSAIFRRQMHAPRERIRALTIQREAWKLRRIADRMERRYAREAAARESEHA